MVKTKK